MPSILPVASQSSAISGGICRHFGLIIFLFWSTSFRAVQTLICSQIHDREGYSAASAARLRLAAAPIRCRVFAYGRIGGQVSSAPSAMFLAERIELTRQATLGDHVNQRLLVFCLPISLHAAATSARFSTVAPSCAVRNAAPLRRRRRNRRHARSPENAMWKCDRRAKQLKIVGIDEMRVNISAGRTVCG